VKAAPNTRRFRFYSISVCKSKGETMNADNEKKTLNYGAFLADLEAKRAALDQAIASLRVAAASGALVGNVGDPIPPMTDGVAVSLHGGEVPVGAFLGKSISEAAKLCLQIIKRKLTTREIADALIKGGVETTAKTSFPAIVHSILVRTAKSGGGIMKLGRSHWALSEWYPTAMQRSVATKSAKRRTRSSRKAKSAPKPASQSQSAGNTIPQKLWQVLNKPGVELSAQEAADKAGTKSNVAAMLLARMVKLGNAEKTASGKYRAIKAA
jgi:hypothetical protein